MAKTILAYHFQHLMTRKVETFLQEWGRELSDMQSVFEGVQRSYIAFRRIEGGWFNLRKEIWQVEMLAWVTLEETKQATSRLSMRAKYGA